MKLSGRSTSPLAWVRSRAPQQEALRGQRLMAQIGSSTTLLASALFADARFSGASLGDKPITIAF